MGAEINVTKESTGRKLVDITMEEIIQLLKLSEGWSSGLEYKMKIMNRSSMASPEKWVRVYYEWEGEEHVVMNISDGENAISIYKGNTYYRTVYRVVKYLERRGFDLQAADASR